VGIFDSLSTTLLVAAGEQEGTPSSLTGPDQASGSEDATARVRSNSDKQPQITAERVSSVSRFIYCPVFSTVLN